jgi:phosphatidylglycerophosphate synthase
VSRFRERYRRMRSRWNEDWWSIAFGGPVANLVNASIADVRWITPDLLTWLAFACKLAAAALVLRGSYAADLAAAALFQLHTVLDCMDGTLARYRATCSPFGAFLDKVTDQIGLCAIMVCLGWRVLGETGDSHALLIAIGIAGSFLLRAYMFWVVAHLERERAAARPTAGGELRRDISQLGFRERAALYARSMVRIVAFAESDMYFWLGLALVLGHVHNALYFLGAATGLWLVIVMVYRWRTVRAL